MKTVILCSDLLLREEWASCTSIYLAAEENHYKDQNVLMSLPACHMISQADYKLPMLVDLLCKANLD